MRCVRELGLPLRHGCRLIMGTDEESGSADLPYYYSEHAPAPNTFTPDTGFPVYNVEKGMLPTRRHPDLGRMRRSCRASSSIDGGFRINVLPSRRAGVGAGAGRRGGAQTTAARRPRAAASCSPPAT